MGLAYVAAYGAGLQILDVSNPPAVIRLGGYDTPGSAYDVQVVGGLAYVDADAAMVMRITSDAEGLPQTLPIQQAASELDYDFVTINDREYLLPLRSLARLRTGKYRSKNEVEFREYRKFGSESTISFDTPEPLPKEETEERTIK